MTRSFTVGLDPSALIAHGQDVLVTNSNDDTVSVIDTSVHGSAAVVQTVNVNPLPGQPFGSSPNALAFLDSGHLVVSLARDNALAIYGWADARTPLTFQGLIPAGWYPGRVLLDSQLRQLVVANQAGVGALEHNATIYEGAGTKSATGKQVYADRGSISLVPLPQAQEMKAYTNRVFGNNRWNTLAARNQIGNGRTAPTAVPLRLGDPSKIKHVFLIVKENRTYDLVLGDDPRGNGDPALAQFGAAVTPNIHAIARVGPLIDNEYSAGTNSAVGHTWLDSAFVNDYLERSYANYVRDYGQPDHWPTRSQASSGTTPRPTDCRSATGANMRNPSADPEWHGRWEPGLTGTGIRRSWRASRRARCTFPLATTKPGRTCRPWTARCIASTRTST